MVGSGVSLMLGYGALGCSLGIKNLCPVENLLFFVERVYTTMVHCLSSRGGSESPDGNSVTRIFGVGVSRIIFHPAAFVKGVK